MGKTGGRLAATIPNLYRGDFMATRELTLKDIDPDWLASYVTKTGVPVHQGVLTNIMRRDVSRSEALVIYFQEDNNEDDWHRISNAWRQRCFRDRRNKELAELRNTTSSQKKQVLRNETPVQGKAVLRNETAALREVVLRGAWSCREFSRFWVLDAINDGDTDLLMGIISNIDDYDNPEAWTGIDRRKHVIDMLSELRILIDEEIEALEEVIQEMEEDEDAAENREKADEEMAKKLEADRAIRPYRLLRNS